MAGPGALVGPYRLVRVLGEGATGQVFEAEPVDGGASVALKLLEPEKTDPDFVERFRRGARATAGLVHENTARILGFGEADGKVYLATELLVGRDLFEVLRAGGVLSEARATAVLAQVCRALEAAHALGVVHRDLKPENVYLVGPAEEHVKVLDFGIAKWMSRDTDAAENAITQLGTLVGTPEYMSPEQCLGEPVDARSDVYACGVLLFQMLTKRTPLARATPTLTAAAHAAEAPPLLGHARPGVDPRLEAIVSRCLEKAPARRFGSARELGEALAAVEQSPRWQTQTSDALQRVTLERLTLEPPTLPAPLAGRPRLRVHLAFGVLAVALALGIWALATWALAAAR